MAVGRISGPLLKPNLIRNGIDLAFETDLLYLKVSDGDNLIGIKTTTPQYELDVNGTIRTTNLAVTNRADIGNVNIQGNTIWSDDQFLYLGNAEDIVYNNSLQVDSVSIEGNTISTNQSNANLELQPNGTGTVEVLSDMNVTGNIHATGNISADGNISIGDADTDNVTFNAEIASNIIPDQNDTYKLGENGKIWNDVWVNQLYATSVTSTNLEVDGIDLTLRQGNIVFVAENGDDTNSGTHHQDPVGSVKYALDNLVSAGDTVFVYPGIYEEEFPLTIPSGVTLLGQDLRSVTIQPTDATKFNNAVLLNGETTIENITIKGFYSSQSTQTVLTDTIDNPTAFSTSLNDQFARAVSVNENYTIISAYAEGDAGGTNSGKAYIYDTATGALLHTLDNPNAYSTSAGDNFGYDVDISDTKAIVGAWLEDDATSGGSSGKAYIFDPATGALLLTLDNPNAYPSSTDRFGASVATTDTHGIVGAYLEDEAGGTSSGKAYIYEYGDVFNFSDVTSINITQIEVRGDLNFGNPAEAINLRLAGETSYNAYAGTNDGSVWELANGNGTWLGPQPSGTALNIEFTLGNDINFAPGGMTNWWEVKLTVDFTRNGKPDVTKELVFGAPNKNAGTVNSDGSGDILYNINQYSFVLDNPNAYSTSTSDYFGWDVDITDDYAIVGAYLEDDAGGSSSGKAYIFDITTGNLIHTLDNPNAFDTSNGDNFGYAVAIDGNRAIVGAYAEDDAGGTNSGKAYIFDATNGNLIHTLDNPNAYSTSTNDYFGWHVDISGNYAIVGAQGEDDAGGSSSGKAYIFDVISGQLQSTLDNPNAYDTSQFDAFGYRVSISNTKALVGAYAEDDAGGASSGKAYMFNIAESIEDGYAFRYADGATVSTRSPYIKNVTVITEGTTVALGTNSSDDPRGFNAGNAGKGVLLDGSALADGSREASMLFHAVTFITPGVDTVQVTNGGRIEWLNSFTYFANRSFYAYDGVQGKYSDGKTRIRLSGVSGTFAAGETVTFTSTDASTVYTKVIDGYDSNTNVITIPGKDVDLLDFDKTPQSISSTGGATATAIENVDVRDFGAEVRMIGSASIYGNFGLVGDGEGVLIYAIGHNLAYIGNGKEVTNDDITVVQANEVVTANGAKIRYNSVDHKGDFRVGDLFYVNQETGTVSFAVTDFNIDTTNGVTITDGSNTTLIEGSKIDVGDWRISNNTIETLTLDAVIDAVGDIELDSNVNITGNLDVTGNVTVGGNITIGDDANDTIQFVAGIDSDIVPSADNTYDLGTVSKTWKSLQVNEIAVDAIQIKDNYITTTESNSDLELRASGTGEILVPNNNVQIDNNLTVNGITSLGDTNVSGTFSLDGDFTHTGTVTVGQDFTVSQNLTVGADAQFEEILIDGNVITTTTSNADLDLRAAGTGRILVPNNDVNITNDLAVTGDITADNLTATANITVNDANIGDVQISGTTVEATASNADLELRANGTGDILVPSNDVILSQDLTVQGNTTLQNTAVNGDITHVGNTTQTGNVTIAGEWTNGNIYIEDNFVTTTQSNSDLELRASGTGEILVPNNNVQIDNNLTVSGTTDLQNTTVTGTITHAGNATQTGNYTITGSWTNGDIQIDSNTIETTLSNSDLELRASGSGTINVPNNNVTFSQALTVSGATDLQNTTITGTITHTGNFVQTGNFDIAGTISNGNIQVAGNVVETTVSNSDLELRASGTGEVLVPNNNVQIDNNLTVSGATDLQGTNVSGTITHTGDTTQTGNYTISGTFTNGDIQIAGNVVETTLSNSDLELRASGSGTINVPSNDVTFSQTLTVNGSTTLADTSITGNITHTGNITQTGNFNIAGEISNGNILIEDNFITTTNSNSDLELRANGTGKLLIPNNDVEITNDLYVTGDAYLGYTELTGNVTITGDITQSGNYSITNNVSVGQNLTVTQKAQLEEILIDDNFITTTTSNTDLELRASGTGKVLIPSNDVDITNNLAVTGDISSQNVTVSGTTTADRFTTGDIVIDDNYITTTNSNSNLELRSSGTGNIYMPDNDVVVEQDLTVSGTTNLAQTIITGDITHTGNTVQTGNITLTGNMNVTGSVNFSSAAQFENIQIAGNVIETTESNSDLELRAAGTGNVIIPDNNVTIANTLTVNGVINVTDIFSTGSIEANNFTTGDILIDDNYITTTLSNSNLELRANGTGSVIIEDFEFSGSTISSQSDITISTVAGNMIIDGTGALTLPTGDISQRPTPVAGQIRFNNENSIFEGYNGSNWIRLDGVQDADGNTKVTAELTPGANDDTIRFDVAGSTIVTIDGQQMTAPKVIVDDVQLDGNMISTVSANTDLQFSANGTGSVVFENFGFKDNTITNTVSGSNTSFITTGTGYVEFADPYGIVLPVGDNATRPAGVTGMVRYNTSDKRVELYDGTSWVSVAGASGGISFADAEDIAIEKVLIFG